MSEHDIVGKAPAKINLGLEVIGRRPDGYHEVVTILQAIDLFDRFVFEPGSGEFEYLGPTELDPSDDMVRQVLDRAEKRERWTGRLTLEKGIPIAAGLGGGSTDAAFALRLAHSALSLAELEARAAGLGSDVPFFVRGGTALAVGTGTELSPLPALEMWFVLVVPQVTLAHKTAQLYRGLKPADFSSGRRVREAAEAINRGDNMLQMPLPNAFTRQMRAIPAVERAWSALERAGAPAVMLSGAGPAIFAPATSEQQARRIASRLKPSHGFVRVARALPTHGDDEAPAQMLAAMIRRNGR